MAQAATQKQINYLLSLGAEADQVKELSVITASAMIKRLLKAKKENNTKEKKTEPKGFCLFLEVPARVELADQSFADSCLTTWLRYHMK